MPFPEAVISGNIFGTAINFSGTLFSSTPEVLISRHLPPVNLGAPFSRAFCGVLSGRSLDYFTMSFNCLPGLNFTTLVAGILMGLPV